MAMEPIAIQITAEKAGESICRGMAAEAHLVAAGSVLLCCEPLRKSILRAICLCQEKKKRV